MYQLFISFASSNLCVYNLLTTHTILLSLKLPTWCRRCFFTPRSSRDNSRDVPPAGVFAVDRPARPVFRLPIVVPNKLARERRTQRGQFPANVGWKLRCLLRNSRFPLFPLFVNGWFFCIWILLGSSNLFILILTGYYSAIILSFCELECFFEFYSHFFAMCDRRIVSLTSCFQGLNTFSQYSYFACSTMYYIYTDIFMSFSYAYSLYTFVL